MYHIILPIVGILLLVVGAFAYRRTQGYLKYKTSNNGTATTDKYWGFGLWEGYIVAGVLAFLGVICIIVSFF
ncbi:hypothetical protein [uncultured Lactobacillus sp.]|uniref:hypothetical protein n=1 Tax=uncultured Lactobacillus sp. TaxID=153152 RepID=UPI00280494B0|nr:hypothetical protein [uncultured Lactobacillus sp.]